MKKLFIALIFIVFTVVPAASGAQGTAESYLYESIPSDGGKVESVNLSFSRDDRQWHYSSRSTKEGKVEEVRIEADAEGHFISGISRTKDLSGTDLSTIRSWRSGNRIYLENLSKGTTKVVTVPEGTEPALDGSVLLLLRPFLGSQDPSRDFFLLSFSGKSIKVNIRNTGLESVSVPAGTFECYRVEINAPVLFLNTRINVWLAKDAPHYLIKQQGKKGPFTASYTTALVRQGNG